MPVPDSKLIDALLAYIIRRGESGAARDEFFEEFRALSYPDLEAALSDLEGRRLVELDSVTLNTASTVPLSPSITTTSLIVSAAATSTINSSVVKS